MAYQKPRVREILVHSISEIGRTAKGNAYLECDTDLGVVAFWGKEDMANIEQLQRVATPVRIRCAVIPSNWPQHQLWVPESSRISVVREETAPRSASIAMSLGPTTVTMDVTPDMLNTWRRRLLRILDRLFGAPEPQDGLISRVTALKREGRIPRKTAALIIALAEIRNVAEHSGQMPSHAEAAAARAAWDAVREWAERQGVNADSL